MGIRIFTAATMVAALLLAGCASTPDQPQDTDQNSSAHSEPSAEPEPTTRAPDTETIAQARMVATDGGEIEVRGFLLH